MISTNEDESEVEATIVRRLLVVVVPIEKLPVGPSKVNILVVEERLLPKLHFGITPFQNRAPLLLKEAK